MLLRWGAFFLGTGSALITTYSVRAEIAQAVIALPKGVYLGILVFGVGFVAVGLVMVAAGVGRTIYATSREVELRIETIRYVIGTRQLVFECIPCLLSDIPRLHKFASSQLDVPISSIETMREWQLQTDPIYWQIFAIHRKGMEENRRLEGYFSVLPLRQQGCRQFWNEEIKAAKMPAQFIATNESERRGLYIGGIGATFRARPAAVAHLERIVGDFLEREKLCVFTKPMTRDGLRLAIRYGFVPVARGEDKLGKVYWTSSDGVVWHEGT